MHAYTENNPNETSVWALLAGAWWFWGLLALALKLLLAIFTFGTNDVASYQHFAAGIADHDASWLYKHDPGMNHPPLVAHALGVLIRIARATGLPFAFCVRLPAIVADMFTLVLLARLLRPHIREVSLLAMAPATILVSGFHGNTDAVMLLFLIAAVYLLQVRQSIPLAALALALAASIKLVPILFLPAFLFYAKGNRARLKFLATTAVAIALLGWPQYFQDIPVMMQNVFGYRSQPGMWGFTRLARGFEHAAGRDGAVAVVFSILRIASPPILAVLAGWLRRRWVTLFECCGVCMFLFVWLLPGFGIQYLAWLAPFAVVFGEIAAVAVLASSGLFMAVVYNYWTQGPPWYYANSFRLGGWTLHYIPLELAVWLIIGVVLGSYLRRMRRPNAKPTLILAWH